MAKRKLFVQSTPLGYVVELTRDRWREIVRYKHPALAGHEDEVRACIRDPAVIRESVKTLRCIFTTDPWIGVTSVSWSAAPTQVGIT